MEEHATLYHPNRGKNYITVSVLVLKQSKVDFLFLIHAVAEEWEAVWEKYFII
jgi:hypothetical protein